ncbi:YqeG family HAD IIIA-type phosphatase [Bacillus carboniphilus]|uniref:YqeG family HAD IIIA-type phosphatase n=1 Tax=Bacillus carboniphilus TaxID=86663 RepID=A0ABY9JX85_9BACI|nr:YqeG family HAD IIIA-type phosphatase [Bacillus carboniphilus]WLR44017.1 YqeG family HAD IIIA-type phosphatase [Bacillus carboniphilus]
MLNLFLPKQFEKSIFDIDPKQLKEKGIKGIITDLDNTLVEWDRPLATPELTKWFQSVKDEGIEITIVSNNKETRVKQFSEPLNISFIYKARKPLGIAFRKALRNMKLNKQEVVVIGDQVLTDVLGGNRNGFHTILVIPVASTDGFFTRMNRLIERKILESFKRKGLLKWEE